MNRTKSGIADYAWNPVTGCISDCAYCYARHQSKRFSADIRKNINDPRCIKVGEGLYQLEEPWDVAGGRHLAFPAGFAPTLHKYRLDWPSKVKVGSTILVCNMGELFGDWVPDTWIEQVFAACAAAPQHRYLFLTKNPARYLALGEAGKLPEVENFWYGSTITTPNEQAFWAEGFHTWTAIEPILESFTLDGGIDGLTAYTDWIVIGAETGTRSDKVIPSDGWVTDLLASAEKNNVPVYMRGQFAGVGKLVQQIPAQLLKKEPTPKQKEKLIGVCAACGKSQRKSDMYALMMRKQRGGKVETFAHVCPDCYEKLLSGLRSEEVNHED